MDKDLDIEIEGALKAYLDSGVEEQVNYQKFYLYSIVTHSTAIEGSTVTEIENQLLFDEGIAAKGRSLSEQMMNVDLKDAYLYAFQIASENTTYTPQLLQQLAAIVECISDFLKPFGMHADKHLLGQRSSSAPIMIAPLRQCLHQIAVGSQFQ